MQSDNPLTAMANLINNSPIGKEASKSVKGSGGSGGGNGGSGGGKGLGGLFGKKKTAKRGVTKARILGDFAGELDYLWELSRPHATNLPPGAFTLPGATPTTPKNEQGCWIIYNTKTDAMRSERFVMSGSRDSCAPGVAPLGNNEEVACFFHTHPNSGEEGYDRGPSPADENFANSNNYPGLVRTHVMSYRWFGRAIPDQ
jgi:hypothetical protein